MTASSYGTITGPPRYTTMRDSTKDIVLRADSATADAAVQRGETGSVYRADGRKKGPLNHGRKRMEAGSFAITRR